MAMLDSHPQLDRSTPARRTPSRGGPVRPTAGAIAALHPLDLDAVRLDPGGLLGQWQQRNTAATLPHCVEQLDRGGALGNLRALRPGARPAGSGEHTFTGMWFADSDVYKTLEAAAWELARPQPGPELRDFVDSTVALLAEVQEPDGYLNSYYVGERAERRWQELNRSHEMYCAGHLIQAAVAAARVGVGGPLPDIANHFAGLLVDRFGPGGTEGVCGHPEIETALVELYRTTGERPYLELARAFVDRRGHGLLGEGSFGRAYFQDHLPVREATEVSGHAVRQLYLLAGMVDVAVETGDDALLASTRRLWDSAFLTKTYLTGAHGSRHLDEAYGDAYELPPERAYAETCAAIASLQWNWRMLLAHGDPRYADELERALYNAVAVSPALDGRHFFYANPLQVRGGQDAARSGPPVRRPPWYPCACCPPNLARLMASVQAYVATGDDSGLQLHLYTAGTIQAAAGGGPVEVTVRGDYPWDGRLALTVRAGSPAPWTLALRVPGWCRDYRIEVDGEPVEARAEGGYVRLRRDWSAATVVLELAMPPRLVAAHPRVDAVRGCLALVRGPLVYCLEQADLPEGVALADVRLDPSVPPRVAGPTGLAPGALALSADGLVPPAAPAELYRDADRPAAAGPDGAALEGAGPDGAALEGGGPATPVALTAIPYFLWANRSAGAMRVWIPTEPAP
jgi:DUF1680 family protein